MSELLKASDATRQIAQLREFDIDIEAVTGTHNPDHAHLREWGENFKFSRDLDIGIKSRGLLTLVAAHFGSYRSPELSLKILNGFFNHYGIYGSIRTNANIPNLTPSIEVDPRKSDPIWHPGNTKRLFREVDYKFSFTYSDPDLPRIDKRNIERDFYIEFNTTIGRAHVIGYPRGRFIVDGEKYIERIDKQLKESYLIRNGIDSLSLTPISHSLLIAMQETALPKAA